MSRTHSLIQRARELAALARMPATPGPWRTCSTGGRDLAEGVSNNGVYFEGGVVFSVYPDPNAELIAAAPAMAQLLKELADALEQTTTNAAVADQERMLSAMEASDGSRHETERQPSGDLEG